MANILILHASVGTGHKTAALALGKAFQLRGAEKVWVQDTLDYGSGVFRKLYADLYLELAEKTPELWGFAYHESNREQSTLERGLRQIYSRIGVYRIDELRELRPDAVICTHFLPIDVVGNSLVAINIQAPIYCVVTDFVGHPFWAHPNVAATFVGNQLASEMLVSHGVPVERIHVTGIPVDPLLAEPKDAGAIRAARDLGGGSIVTLIASGLDGEMVRRMVEGMLRRPINGTLLIVTGRSPEVQKSLEELPASPTLTVKVLGFVDYLDDLIAASDLIISKAGGLITSEVMARGTPLLVVDPVRGQEEYNADYVAGSGVGTQARLPDSVPYMAELLLRDPERLQTMRARAREFGRPRAALDVADIVLKGLDDDSRKDAKPPR
jgi:processive 1,2-diacylglycerol beta-glucosyltransferase